MSAKVHRAQLNVGEDPPTGLAFWCPACDGAHVVRVGGAGGWTWNGDSERPTIEPSVKVETPRWDEAKREFVPDKCCHSVVTDGAIRFCGDCTHALVNQTVSLPDWPFGDPKPPREGQDQAHDG